MKLIAGLGNPGGKYAANRHNIGFMAVDEIARRHGFSPWRRRFSGLAAEGRLGGDKVILLKPMTYMNESGRSLGEAMRFYKLEPADVLVIHDELDLAPGKARIKSGGGHAGHNGLRSIMAHIGADFHRLRLGIGHPGDKRRVHDYVLRDFTRAERKWLEPLLEAVADNAPLLVEEDYSTFLNRLHMAVAPALPKKDDEEQD